MNRASFKKVLAVGIAIFGLGLFALPANAWWGGCCGGYGCCSYGGCYSGCCGGCYGGWRHCGWGCG